MMTVVGIGCVATGGATVVVEILGVGATTGAPCAGTIAGALAGAFWKGFWSAAGGGSGASGSGWGCANTGAAQIKAAKASSPDFKRHPPSATTNPSMPRTCLRVD